MSEFKMPSLGADMESAILMEWMVKEGDPVKKGDVIAEVETSKGVIEIEVFEDGIVEKLLVEEETECAVGTPLALIRSDGSKIKDEPEKAVSHLEIKPIKQKPSENFVKKAIKEETSTERIKVSPVARKRADELGIDLIKLSTHTDGVIQLSDVESCITEERPQQAHDGMREAISKAMSRSNAEIPHYYLSTTINMTPVLQWLRELNNQRSIKERILPAAVLIRATVLAIKAVPELNGFWREGKHQISKEVHPGITIALRKGGLINPALLNAQNMSLDETMQSLDSLVTRTRSGKLRSSEMTEQTISITNLGDLGVERVYGVIYPPQVAIIGLGRIMDAPWAEGDSLSIRKVIQATLAGDHRATDGRTGGMFLDKLNYFLQRPEELI